MEASHDLRSHVTDLATCPICLELSDNPKSLPCLHTFCLKCIEHLCRDKEPGDEVACPMCRQEFNIPQGGVKGLVSNFFIADLVEDRKTASDVVQVPCEVCLLECVNDNSNVAVSTMYCVHCEQKLCERCSVSHNSGPHKVVVIGGAVEITDLIRRQGGKCDRHQDEDVRLYCMDCEMNICVVCVAREHQQHRYNDISVVAAECVKQIDSDMTEVEKRADGARKEISRLDGERRNFQSRVQEVKDQLVARGEELKQLIDSQVNELKSEVQSMETAKCKEIDSFKDDAEVKLLAFETFGADCSELKLKGKPCDITRAANDLHSRATELLQNDITVVDYCAPTVLFLPMDIQGLLDIGQNFIGKINPNNSTVTSSSISFETRGMKSLEQQLAQAADTECSLRQQIEVHQSRLADNDKMWTERRNTFELQVKLLKEQESALQKGKLKSKATINELLEKCKQLRNSDSEFERLRTSEESLQEELRTTSDREQRLIKHLQIVQRVVHTLPEAKRVVGVTSLDDELYVLRDKDKEQVEVYNTTTTTTQEYRLVRTMSLPDRVEFGYTLCDIVSCKHYRCLYVADYSHRSVHRVELNGEVIKFTELSVNSRPRSLSVTSQFTVIVTCTNDSKLIELTTEGNQLREITLQSEIVRPQHAIQLSNGQFFVCHGGCNDPVHRVCIVDTNGHVTQSYGGPRGSATVGQLNGPRHLAVDKDEFIFVADSENGRVLLLSPTLNFVREIVSRDQLKWKPDRIYLESDVGAVQLQRLYIGDTEIVAGNRTKGRVVVVKL